MNKEAFLAELRSRLSGLPEEDLAAESVRLSASTGSIRIDILGQ